MLVRDSNNQYLKIQDIEIVFTENKEEASSFADMSADDFATLKKHIEQAYDTTLETFFE
ncbi:hypothetical protein Curi_c06160 [Gottschalkia acidurici 9a]|uniref:Uncharacterized protein n=2 Tax=Clostridium acidurici TaxID=1556 RepID=K0AWS6_GOTA9|nr:hypothetical protein Curi_c06160 [Gottschalkia acidurici 9a]